MSKKEVTVIKVKKLIVNVSSPDSMGIDAISFGESVDNLAEKVNKPGYDTTLFHLRTVRDMAMATKMVSLSDSDVESLAELIRKTEKVIASVEEICILEKQIQQSVNAIGK